jgi:hypothetical protein
VRRPWVPLSTPGFPVRLAGEEGSRPAIGQVVTYRLGHNLVTHRITGEWTGNGHTGPWQLTGDANKAPDAQLVPTSAIVGQVVSYLPVLGLVSDLLQLVPVIVFLVLLAVLLLHV